MSTFTRVSLFKWFFCCTLFWALNSFAQTDVRTIDMNVINQMKLDGRLTGAERFVNPVANPHPYRIAPVGTNEVQSTSCNCWIPRDPTWQVAAFNGSGGSGGPGVSPDYRNDDWSTVAINLPFNFCFYNIQETQLFINNNGNVSFGAAYSTYTADSFPDGSFSMVAPFWADVDTRGLGSGIVYYKLTATHLIVQWDHVGYFNMYDDKLNTFQLIITDGLDTLLPQGQNVSFCYKDMQWTTGDASGGTNGFGGTPATVGVNRGNGVDYIQIGRYDTLGSLYDGPFGDADGIDALDFQSYYFNACTNGANIPPLVNSTQVCDTLTVCANDTLLITANYLSPEQGQITIAGVNPNGTPGVSVLSSTQGNIATEIIQIIAPTTTGLYLIFLTGTDNGVPPLTSTSPIYIRIIPGPTAMFTYSPASPITPGTAVTFTNSSTGGFSFHWNFGDGSPQPNVQNPIPHTYTTVGQFTVTLTVTSPNGCISIYQQVIDVTQCATVNAVNAGNVCAGTDLPVTYNGTASATATFNWSFGGGTIVSGSGRGPYVINYALPGNYNILLTVTDGTCTSNPVNIPVTIYDVPVASVTGVPVVCAGAMNLYNYTGTAIPGANYTWNFGTAIVVNGSLSGPYTLQWNGAGPEVIQVIVNQNNCIDTATYNVLVEPIPSSTFTVAPGVCEGDPLTLTYTGGSAASAGYNWNFGSNNTILSGSGQGPYSVSWSAPGPVNVSLTVTENGCPSLQTVIPITINPDPVASIAGTSSLCAFDQNIITFTGTATVNANYNWTFGNATVLSGTGQGPYTLQWNNDGTDQISLIVDQLGCRDTATFDVQINPIPTSDFVAGPLSVCEGEPVTITYTGTGITTATYTWNFTGATVISGSNSGPYTVVWNSAGTPDVSLTVTQNGCISVPTVIPVSVNVIPVASFTATPSLCTGEQNIVTFTGTAVAGATFNWDFDNATVVSGTGQGPYTLSWTNAGNEQINLIVDQNGCSDSSNFAVTIYPIPTSDFILPANECAGSQVSITYTGTASSNATYTWVFNGGAVLSGTGQGPYSVIWGSPGINNVQLSVTEDGCTSVVTDNAITIGAYPIIDAGTDAAVCSGLIVPIGSTAETGVTYLWWPATGISDPTLSSTSIQTNNTSTSTAVTDYILTATAPGNCVSIDTVNVTVYPIPLVSFIAPSAQCYDGNAFNFAAGGNLIPGAQYSWDFGIGATPATSTDQNPPPVSYSSLGTHTITLNAVYNNCPAVPFIDDITVNESPFAGFFPTVTEGCTPLTVPFINQSTGTGNIYSWNFEDESGVNSVDPTHTFTTAGVYTVTLRATTPAGCTDDTVVTDLISAYQVPIASFTPSPEWVSLWEPLVSYMNTSVYATEYSWDFGDSTYSQDVYPSHVYQDTGTYTITLYVNTPNGCRDTITGVVRVDYGFTFFVPEAFTPNGDGINDYFRGFGISVKEYDMHIFDRWGRSIFHTNDINTSWDGKIKDAVQSDVYVYQIRLVDLFGESHEYIGKVTVVR